MIKFLMDMAQIALAFRVIWRGVSVSRKIEKKINKIDAGHFFRILKRQAFSPKDRIHAVIAVTIVFLLPQIVWTFDNLSYELSSGQDIIWFFVGMIVLFFLDTELTLLNEMWKKNHDETIR